MIGNSIKKHRNERKISQRALAKASGVSFAYIQQLEKGLKTNPSLDILNKIADSLYISLDELLNTETTSFSSKLIASILRMDYITIAGESDDYGFETISRHTGIDINALKNCIERNIDLPTEDQLKLIDFWSEWGCMDDGIELEDFVHMNDIKVRSNPIISNKIKSLLYGGVAKNNIEKLFDLLERYNFTVSVSKKDDQNVISIYKNGINVATELESNLTNVYEQITSKINSYSKFIIEDELNKLKND